MKVISRALLSSAVALALAGRAAAMEYLAYEGKPVVKNGDGGTRRVVDGVDFWQAGDPPHRYQVIGTIQDSRHETGLYGVIRMSYLYHDIAKAVRAAGGDGVILSGEGEQVVGIASSSSAFASGSFGYNNWNANGSSFGMVRPMKSHQVSYVVVKYLSGNGAAIEVPPQGVGPVTPVMPPAEAVPVSRF